jgi:hypothetical protein
MPEWTLVLASRVGVALADLNVTPVMRWEENRPMTIRFPFPHDMRNASRLYEILDGGLPQLRAYLDGDLKFSGRFAPLEEKSDDSESQATVTFKSPLGMLEQRFLATDLTYTGIDQALIAWSLIGTENTKGVTGLIQGSLELTVARDRTYEARKQVLEALVQLSEVQNGVTFWETPLDPNDNAGALAAFNAGPRPGVDRTASVKFEMGEGTLDNCISVERQIGYPVNRATTVGDGTPPLTSVQQDTDSQAKYGIWERVESMSGVTIQATLDARALEMLAPNPVQIVTFQPDPAEALRPWDDWWLGDTVSFKADVDALQIATTARPRALEIELDDQGNETAWRVEWGDQRPLERVFRERLRALTRS